ncbi:sensor histidine kinase, partial [Methylobacterium hispanicum]
QRRITLSFEGPEAPVVARVEPLLVEEILRNLIDNAIRYNRPGGRVRVSVTREATREGFERACIDVEDDGPGIPEDRHARVFERFYRLERQDDPTGSGLGLAIVKAFAERLGGTVSLHPGIDGRGLRVRVALTSAVAG